jgi:hypothetical protein
MTIWVPMLIVLAGLLPFLAILAWVMYQQRVRA